MAETSVGPTSANRNRVIEVQEVGGGHGGFLSAKGSMWHLLVGMLALAGRQSQRAAVMFHRIMRFPMWRSLAVATAGLLAAGCGKSSAASPADGSVADQRLAEAADTGMGPERAPLSDVAALSDGRVDLASTTDVGKDSSAGRDSSVELASAPEMASDVRVPDDGARDGVTSPETSGLRETSSAPDVPAPSEVPQGADAPTGVEAGQDGAPDTLATSLGSVTVVRDEVLSSNATTVKSYDTNVNVASYRQHGILYFGGYQFVAWYNGNARNVVVARRTFDTKSLAGGMWAWAYVDFKLASGADSHNVISMGISESDGRLHLAIGQHGAQLYYARSVAGAVTGTTWDNSVFGGSGTSDVGAAAPSAGMPNYGAATDDVTYPYFIRPDAKTLQLAYRTGTSGDGEMQLAEYSAVGGAWSYVGPFTSASGSYTQNGVTSGSRNAYPHGFDYDEAGRLHMAFTWRENLDTAFIANCSDAINNHDTLYVYSDDRGRTWKNNAGATVAEVASKQTAGVSSFGLVIDPLAVGRDMMNQESQITDHNNLLHVVISYIPDTYQPGCATDRTQAQPFHLWRAADGSWTKTQIKLGGQDVNQGYDRAKIFVDASDNAYVLLPDLRLVGASARTQWTDWQLLWDGRSRGNYGEAIIDVGLTRAAAGVSVLYMKDTSSNTGELRVLDLRIASGAG